MKNAGTILLSLLLLAATSGLLAAQAPALPRDVDKRQLSAGGQNDDGADWVLYGRSYKAWRYSPLTQITRDNVQNLQPAWQLPTGLHDAFEATPIVVDGVMYFSTPWNHAYAVDAATGKIFWHYAYPLKEDSLPLCCGAVNRGVGIGSGKVIMATLDAHLVALDARTGEKVWDTQMADPKQGYSATIAPQVIGSRVIVGISGGDFGVRGFVDSYDIDSGRRQWRFWTIPGPGEPGHDTWSGDSWKTGGGPNWIPCTYDPQTETIFVGIGNPGPDVTGDNRQGDNLYTECTVALDVNSGKIKWHYQTVPHDVWDLDNTVEPVIDEITWNGQQRQVVMHAGKNGYFYVLDRTNGQVIYAMPYSHRINWGKVTPDGKPQPDKSKYPVKDKWTVVYPGAQGGKEWVPVAYDPQRKRLFIPCIENGHRHKVIQQEFHPGQPYWGGVSAPVPNEAYGHVAAIDVEKGTVAWDTRTEFPVVAGVTCTAGGLVITGTPDQKMLILDSDTGKELWTWQAPSGWHSAPAVYSVNGVQYIAFANGWGGWVAGFDLMGTPRLEGIPKDNVMFAFSLPQQGRQVSQAQAQQGGRPELPPIPGQGGQQQGGQQQQQPGQAAQQQQGGQQPQQAQAPPPPPQQGGQTAAFTPYRELTGQPVANTDGSIKGQVADLVINARGEIRYLAANLQAQGQKQPSGQPRLVPVDQVRFGRQITVDVRPDDLQKLQALQNGQLPQGVAMEMNTKHMLASQLQGATLVGQNDETLGEVQGAMFDLQQKKLAYLGVAPSGVLGLSQPLYAVPASDLQSFDLQQKHVVTGLSGQQLGRLTGFGRNDWPQQEVGGGQQQGGGK